MMKSGYFEIEHATFIIQYFKKDHLPTGGPFLFISRCGRHNNISPGSAAAFKSEKNKNESYQQTGGNSPK